jgi:hypothetical protein
VRRANLALEHPRAGCDGGPTVREAIMRVAAETAKNRPGLDFSFIDG